MNENLTAYALNELPPDERAAFEAQMKNDPALRKQAEEMKDFCTLLEREVAQDADTLMPEQRAQLVQHFQNVRGIVRPLWRRPAFLSTIGFAAAACLAMMLTMRHLKEPGETILAPAPTAPADNFRQDQVAVLKEADEPSAGRVTVKPAGAEKRKGLAKSARPATSPATPSPQAIDGMIAVNTPPMPVLPGQPVSAPNAGTAIQIPEGALDLGKSLPAVQLTTDAIMNFPSRNLIADSGALSQAAPNTNNPAAATAYAAINGAGGMILSNSTSPANSSAMNGGTLEYQAPNTANLSPAKSDAGAARLDLNGYVAANGTAPTPGISSNPGNSGANGLAQTPSSFGAYGSNSIDTIEALSLDKVSEGKIMLPPSQLNLGSNMPNGNMTFGDGVTLNSGSTLMNGDAARDNRQFRFEEQTANGRMSGSGTVDASGTGAVVLNGNGPVKDAAGVTTKSETASSGGALQTLKAAAGNLILSGSNSYTGGTVISGGTTSIIKSGSGSLTFGGSNTYTGTTTVNAGEMQVRQTVGGKKDSDEGTKVAPGAAIIADTSTTSTLNRSAGAGVAMPQKRYLVEEEPASVTMGGAFKSNGVISGTAGTTAIIIGSSSNTATRAPTPAPALVASDPVGFTGDITINNLEPRLMKEVDDFSKNSQRHQSNLDFEKAKRAGTATYRPIIENPFTFVAQQPLSTFSLDVDTASYANVRRFLNSGQRPPPDAVRLEELVNYFPYRYEGPAADRPIGVQVDLADAPWQPLHRIARVAVKARDVKGERSAANFVFLLDVSGSMEPNERLPLIKQSLRLLVEQLREDDRVAIVTYAGESGVALESTPGTQKEKIREAIQRLKAGGSTNGAGGIRLAYEQAALNFNKDRINRVILCTDGDFNVGASSVQELENLIAEKARSGVFLSVLGVGTDNLHDHTMQAIADRGNGNYHYLDSVGEARKVLVEQMTGTLVTVAKDVKLQVEFNPAQVAAYRLIGYEKRMLAREDFNNDKKDAGELGAGHTVTALYEIVPASLKYPDGKPLVDDLKYALAPGSKAATAPEGAAAPAAKPAAAPATNETMTVKVRYKEPGGDQSKLLEVPVTDAHKKLSESDREFQFAVSVAGFGMLLRGSPNVAELSWEGVRRLALAGKGDDEQGWRGEFIQLIEKARGLCEERR